MPLDEKAENILFYGDNLHVLQEHIEDESVDLVYLDPPFNSNQDYNVLFAERDGSQSAAQIKAFTDTWRWDQAAAEAYQQVVEFGGKPSQALQGFRTLLGQSDMMAYLSIMAPRLIELRRVMKSTASIYLHCDPTASHYLKLLCDAIFGPEQFRSEIIWRRTGSHNSSRRFGPIHDVILFFSKTNDYYFRKVFRPYLKGHVEGYFKSVDDRGRRYWTNALTGAGTRNGESGLIWHGYDPTVRGRHWAIPGKIAQELGIDENLSVQQRLDALDAAGFIDHPGTGSDAMPTYRQMLESSPGMPLQDIWTYQPHSQGVLWDNDEGIDEDVSWLKAQGDEERLGYPTQKPIGLLERIIASSCPADGVVLDPFCGCGTTVVAAQALSRRWIGIDITHLAVTLMKHRLFGSFGSTVRYRVLGEPEDLAGAAVVAAEDPYQFQLWALGLLNARPANFKKGSDKGIDGQLFFHDEGPSGKTKQIVFSVKAGKVSPTQLRDLIGVVERDKAEIGVFISLNDPTRDMRADAASSGYYVSPALQTKHPKIQLLTIKDIFDGKRLDVPMASGNVTFQKAQKVKVKKDQPEAMSLFGGEPTTPPPGVARPAKGRKRR